MKFTSLFFSCLFVIFYTTAKSQDHPPIHAVTIQPNQVTTVEGNLSEGMILNDLSWAWNSSIACFPATQQSKFNGNHVFYTTVIPKYSEMEIKVIPKDPKANLSIYAYEMGEGRMDLVPNLSSCIRCEVDHKWDRPFKGKTQDHTRTAKNIVAINRAYQVMVGVVGAEGLTSGDYTLEFHLKSRSHVRVYEMITN